MSVNKRAITLVLVAGMLVFCLLSPCFAGETQIVDEGSAGNPGRPTDHVYVHSTTEVSYSSAEEALSNRFSDSQMDQISTMMTSGLGISLDSLTGNPTGTNNKMVQWSDPRPEPDGPTTNWENVNFTTPEGYTVTLITQITGAEGTYGSTENRGGTGTTWIVITDADGNTSYLALHMQGGNIEYQEFHAEDMIADNAEVRIDGPTAVDEDGENQWRVVVPDSNLPEEDEDVFEVKWSGPPSATWQASGGQPSSGSGETFSTKFTQPGSAILAVEATREYQFKTYRAEPNPDYDENTDPLEDAFIQVLKTMSGTVRGSASLSVTVADVTPPEITFTLTPEHGPNTIDVKESPLDIPAPKTVSVGVDGTNLNMDIGQQISWQGSAPASEPIFIGSTLDPQIMGFIVRQHERFKISAAVKDNHTPVPQVAHSWRIENLTAGKEVIPEGNIEYALVRVSNMESGDDIFIYVQAADDAGNITKIEIPLLAISQESDIRNLGYGSRRKN